MRPFGSYVLLTWSTRDQVGYSVRKGVCGDVQDAIRRVCTRGIYDSLEGQRRALRMSTAVTP